MSSSPITHSIHSSSIALVLFTCTLAIGPNRFETTLLTSDANNVISPWSIVSTLIPLEQGADGETKEELNEIIKIYRNANIRSPSLGTSVTALFTSGKLLPSYKSSVARRSPSLLLQEDFSFSDDNVNNINKLIERGTQGLIKDIIRPGQLSPDTKMIVVNAFYFKGNWRIPFTETRKTPFYTLQNGREESTRLNMMYQRSSYYIADIPELQSKIIEIPYAFTQNSTSTTVLQIILPDEKFGLSQLMSKLVSFDLKSIRMKLAETDLYLPKFKIESDVVLDAEVAKKVGLSKTFSEANLSKLSSTSLRVDKIISRTMIDVNEEGTEGASGTSAFIVPLSGLVYDSFVVDHPFVFYILEGSNILFSGAVTNPSSTSTKEEPKSEVSYPPRIVNLPQATLPPDEDKATIPTTTPEESRWWVHTGKPEYLLTPAETTVRFQQPEPAHPSGIRFPYPSSDHTSELVIHSHLQNQSSLNNTV